MPSKRISELILQCYKKVGLEATVRFLDDLKELGFVQSTKAAISMGLKDVKIPEIKKEILKDAYDKVAIVKKQYEDGIITDGERHSKRSVFGLKSQTSCLMLCTLRSRNKQIANIIRYS